MNTPKSTFVELHVLQSFVPSNPNRDDNGYPKSGLFGGARRARISSQNGKFTIRSSDVFKESIAPNMVGERTRRMLELFVPRLVQLGRDKDKAEIAVKAFTTVYAGLDRENQNFSSVLVFLSQEDIDLITKVIMDNWDIILDAAQKPDGKIPGKDTLKKVLGKKVLTDLEKATKNRTSAPDIALYGRMLADNPEFALDAACQVANALSTHAVEEMEVDYFTAVDTLQSKDDPGAGTIQSTGFNSACYYRYARLDWDQLTRNLSRQGLSSDTDVSFKTVNGFLRAVIETVPTGMKNRFAQFNPPDFVLAVVRNGGPAWSLANAFEKPIRANDDGYLEPSVKALDNYWRDMRRAFGSDTLAAVSFFVLKSELGTHITHLRQMPEGHAAWGEANSLEDWRNTVLKALRVEKVDA